jgi:hypothetical protein
MLSGRLSGEAPTLAKAASNRIFALAVAWDLSCT